MTNHSLCGVLKSDGRDCDDPVAPGSPFNICRHHYLKISDYLKAAESTGGYRYRISMLCPGCQIRYGLVADVSSQIATCSECGHQVRATEAGRSKFTPMQRPEQLSPSTVVYYIRFGDRIKIGTTDNLRNRLAALPYDQVLFTEPGSYELENQRHKQFRRHLVRGQREWFHAHPELLDFIRTQRAAKAA